MPVTTLARIVLWLLVAAGAWAAPTLAEPFFRKFESSASKFAAHSAMACVSAALLVLVTRVALLPLWPIPKPYVYDEFGYILQSDTFASLRLTNPPHPLAPFFETIYELQRPTYNAKFPPGQGLMLSLGQMIFDHPWFGVWLSCGLLAAALCWALQGWFRPAWALFGTIIAMPLCITSYWMNTYWGGAVTAIGGCLVIGAVGRGLTLLPALLLALGSILVIYTRPFEGTLLLIPVFLLLVTKQIGWKSWAVILLTGAAGAGWLGYYNYRVTGSPTNLPYFEYDRQYPSTPHLNILPLPPPHSFSSLNFTLMDRWEREAWAKARSTAFLKTRFKDVYQMLDLFLGSVVLLIPVALFWRNLVDTPKLKILWWCLLAGCIVIAVGTQYYQHYAAPIFAVIVIVTVEAFRHLRVWKYQGKPAGKFLTRAIPAAMLILAAVHQARQFYPRRTIEETYPPNVRRERIEEALAKNLGEHVIFVRYTKYRFPQEEWIYNRADIDNSPVIWAQDRGPQENRRLMDYYKGRSFWLMKPDENPDQVDVYDSK